MYGQLIKELVPCAFPLIVAAIGFWIWMMIDCAVNEPPEDSDKIIWMLIIILTGWIGALIYFCVRRPMRSEMVGR